MTIIRSTSKALYFVVDQFPAVGRPAADGTKHTREKIIQVCITHAVAQRYINSQTKDAS